MPYELFIHANSVPAFNGVLIREHGPGWIRVIGDIHRLILITNWCEDQNLKYGIVIPRKEYVN